MSFLLIGVRVIRRLGRGIGVVGRLFPCASTSGEFGSERVEARLPEPSERVEPGIGGREGRRVDGVQPPCAVGADGREPRLAQHTQMLRDRRLRDLELPLNHLADLARTELAVYE